MKKMRGFVVLFLILFMVWILLAGINIQELTFGGIAVLLITFLFPKKSELFNDVKLNPKSIVFMILYLFVFLWELIKSNLDVALRVLSPTLPINPGIVTVKTKLKSKVGRAILANSITLTPGTLTVETKEDTFFIHWIDVASFKEGSKQDIDLATREIVSNFEKYLEVIFG